MTIRRSALILASVLLGAGVASGQQPKYGVSVMASNTARLEKVRTYAWAPSLPSPDPTIDQQITAAIDHELGAIGLKKVTPGPADVLATYRSLSRTDVDVKAKAPDGKRPEYAVGVLVIDLLDPASRDALFSVRIDTPIDADRSKLEGAITAAVAEMLQKYPIRAGSRQ